MEKYKIYVGGKFTETSTPHEVINPFTQEVFANTYLGGKEELESAIIKAELVADEMKNLPSYRRFEILSQISNEITKDRERLALVLTKESGKPLRYSLGEIDRASQTFLVAAEESKRLPKEYISLDWTKPGENKEGIIKYFPIGLVAGISPFNFPINLAVHKIAPAIAAGCPIILKPASATPLSTLELAKIIDATSLPKGAVSVIPMNRKDGEMLVTDERFKLLSFTGSPTVGWEMKKKAGKKNVLLELGGNAGVIVSKSADITDAVKKCLVSGFAYSGQICIHAQRLFIQEDIFDPFLEKFIEGVKKLKYGDPENITTDISVMIDEENAKRVEDWVNESVKKGAKNLIGGKRNGVYYEPTVLTNTNNNMKVCSEEIFGPVVTVEKFSSFEQAVQMINDTSFGLQAGVFTNNINESHYAFNNIQVGGLMINDAPTLRLDHMPYGGIKNSGLGREGVKYAIQEMMEPRILITTFSGEKK